MIDLAAARETFEVSKDLTVGIEEEWALLDPETLDLVPRFEQLRDAGASDPVLADAIAGELISSEIEIRSGRGEDIADARAKQQDARRRLFALAESHGVRLGSTGTHPLSDYREQHIIDTEHYHRVEEGLKYVAWRNNTFALQVHVGVQGADRAVRVCDRLRPVLPLLLAISANSPYVDQIDSGLHTARTQIFTKSFPRCGVPDAFGGWARVVGLRRPARPHRLDRRVHAAVVVGPAAPLVRDRRGPRLRRPDHGGGGRRPRRADGGVRGAGAAGDRCGRDPSRSARTADRGEHVARHPLRAGRAAARSRGRADRGVPRHRGARPA